MDLQQLEIFLAVAEHHSFTRAAEMLYISHSTTSRNVSALEESLGVSLLVRDNRSVELTPAGELLCREGRVLLRYMSDLEDAVRSVGLGYGRRLTVAVAPLVPDRLPDCVKEFCLAHQEVHVSVLRCELGEVWKLVESGEADLGVTILSSLPESVSGMESISYRRGGLKLAVASSDPMAKIREVPLEHISGREFVCDKVIAAYLPDELRAKNTVTLMPTVDSLLLRVATGGALALVPGFLTAATKYGCQLVDSNSDRSEEAVMIWKKKNQNPSLEELLRNIRKLMI